MGGISNFLYAQPSAVEGAARIFDLANTLFEYNEAVDGKQADLIAMRMDWLAVGQDLREALAKFEREHPLSPTGQPQT
jgi:hypothetical protein